MSVARHLSIRGASNGLQAVDLSTQEHAELRTLYASWSKGTNNLDLTSLIRHLRGLGLVSHTFRAEPEQCISNDVQIMFTQVKGKAAKLSYDTFLNLLALMISKTSITPETLKRKLFSEEASALSRIPTEANSSPSARQGLEPSFSNVSSLNSRPSTARRRPKQEFDHAASKAFNLFKRKKPAQVTVNDFMTTMNLHFAEPQLTFNVANRLLKRVQYQHTVTPITLLSFSKFCEKEHFKAAPRVRPQEKQEKPLPPPTPEPALERLPSVSSEPTMVIELDPDTVDALEGVFVLYSMEYSFDERNSEEVLSLDGFTSLISKVGLLEPDCLRYPDVEELFEEHATNGFLVFDAFPQCLVTAAQKCRFEFSDVMESILSVLTELGAYEQNIYATESYTHPAGKSELVTNDLVPLCEHSASSSFQEILKPSVAKPGVSPEPSTEARNEHHKLSRDFLRSQDQQLSPAAKNRCTPRASTAFSSSDLSQLPARASTVADFSFPPSSVFETPQKPSVPPLLASRTFSSSEPVAKQNQVQKKIPEFELQAEKSCTQKLSPFEPPAFTKQSFQKALPSRTDSSEPPYRTSDVDEGQSRKANSAAAPASVTTEATPPRSREELKAEKAARKAERNRKREAKAARAADRDRRRAEKQELAAQQLSTA